MLNHNILLCFLVAMALLIRSDRYKEYAQEARVIGQRVTLSAVVPDTLPAPLFVTVSRDVPVRDYFQFLKEVVESWDSLLPYPLSEHLLVCANPWIIDSLENTDYYRRKLRVDTVWVQPKEVILHRFSRIL